MITFHLTDDYILYCNRLSIMEMNSFDISSVSRIKQL